MEPQTQPSIIKLRPAQEEAFFCQWGVLGMIWRRQFGKSYDLGTIALDWMMETPGVLVTFISAALRLGMENIRKEKDIWAEVAASIAKEAAVWREVTSKLKEDVASRGEHRLSTNAEDDFGNLLDVDAIADMFEHQKLETKLWFDNVMHSRSIVIAPNPDTAVGWTGHLILDEVGRMPNFRDMWEAAEPFVASRPDLKIRMATTVPPDDSHFSYEMLSPEDPDQKFPVNPRGNFYTSGYGIPVHRVDAFDAYAGGVPIYDLKTREPLTPEEARRRALDKDAWDRNFGCRWIKGGAAALGLAELQFAMTQGSKMGIGVQITEEIREAA
jgi:hypothetical protein